MNLAEQLSRILSEISLMKVDMTLIIGAILLLILGLIKNQNRLIKGFYAIVLLFACSWKTVPEGTILSDTLYMSLIAQNFTCLFLLVSLLILVFPRSTAHSTEFYFFVLSILIGSEFMMKANSLIIVFMAVELTSFASYIITTFSFKKHSYEAGIKYLLFGAVSSAVMLFGMTLIYGATGSVLISEWNPGFFSDMLPLAGLLMMIFGILFKASIVPFHIWVPATYQYAPNDATAFLSIVPKLAALVLLRRIFESLSLPESHWLIVVCLSLGIFTMVMGTFSALSQSSARRMISMGAIAHSGFLLPFAFMTSPTAVEAFWWYAVAYALMNLLVFYLLDGFENQQIIHTQAYAGLGSYISLIGVIYTAGLVSLAGLPPFAGFTAKLFLFISLWETYLLHNQSIYMIYLVTAILITLISLFFYLRIPCQLFLAKNVNPSPAIEFKNLTKFIATLFSVALLLLFFVPKLLIAMQQLLNASVTNE